MTETAETAETGETGPTAETGPTRPPAETGPVGHTRPPAVDLSELDDIPGTTVFTAQRSRQGYWLNQFCMSLMKPENRTRFKADERAYLDEWPMAEAQKQAVLARDYAAAIAEGGNIYFLAKLFLSDGKTFQDAAQSMTGMSPEEYAEMMLKGGRSPEGWRSIKEGR